MKVSQSIYIQLGPITYNKAIKHYSNLKNSFLKDYNRVAKETYGELQKQVETEIAKGFQTGDRSMEEVVQKTTKQLYEDVALLLETKLKDANKTADIKKLRAAYKTKSKREQDKAVSEAKKLGEELLPDNELKKIIVESLSRLQVGSSFDASTILEQVRGYRTKYLSRSTAKKRSIDITKGFYQEALVHKAFGQLLDHLDETIDVMHTGAQKVNNLETVYDEYIRFSDQLNSSFTKTVSYNLNIGYGLQSKPWKIPITGQKEAWALTNNKYGFGIGSRAELLAAMLAGLDPDNKEFNERNWLYGVKFLEQAAITAIGPRQLGYIVPKGFIWTADLITNFRANQYYLAFRVTQSNKFSKVAAWTFVEPRME